MKFRVIRASVCGNECTGTMGTDDSEFWKKNVFEKKLLRSLAYDMERIHFSYLVLILGLLIGFFLSPVQEVLN